MSKETVLITGGTGLIGARLTEILQEKGYKVTHLSRSEDGGNIPTYVWDIPNGKIDMEAISTADYIINLAGAGLMDKRWTKKFKKIIIDSRINSVHLIYKSLIAIPNNVRAVVSASAIGYYSSDTGSEMIDETCPPGNDFLSEVVRKWEDEINTISKLTVRTVALRIGIVLSDKGGALTQLIQPFKWNLGSSIASGRQYMSWIHIDDLCHMFVKAIEDNNMSGPYNAVAPVAATNKEVTHEIAKAMGKSVFLPNVPAFIMKIVLGSEKAKMVIGGNNVSPGKIQAEGFQFKFPELRGALTNLLNK